MRAMIVFLLPTMASAVYQLTFLGDWQSGGKWDTDSAENLAVDTASQRAFIASAESKEVRVVSILDPTKPETVGTLAVGAVLQEACLEEACVYSGMDFGGEGSPCGFAETVGSAPKSTSLFFAGLISLQVRIVHDREDFDCCSWFPGPFEWDPAMTSPEACQRKCADEPSCSYWSYEDECEQHADNATCTSVRHHECFLKSRYANDAECAHYVVWEEGPHWSRHDYDPFWTAAAGPAVCGTFEIEKVKSVAVLHVPDWPNAIVAAAAPHKYEFADGALAFFDAHTQVYLGCKQAGNKPEGLVVAPSKVACINEGSARDDGKLDHQGGTTVCDLSVIYNPTVLDFSCTTYPFTEDHFVPGAFLSPVIYRKRGVRLYGPDGDDVSLDLEPENAVFLNDATVLMVSFQSANAYIFLDLSLSEPKYNYLGGYDLLPATLDASDKDGYINIKSSFGDATPVWALAMPDMISAITINGAQYIVTANEGDTRDGEDVLGIAEAPDGTEIEGEESRYGNLGDPPVATCQGCVDDRELGRLLTTVFLPSDFAMNACGGNTCDAATLAKALDPVTFNCQYENYDYGRDADETHPCGFAPTPGNAYIVSSPDWSPPGWYSGTVSVDTEMLTPSKCQAACAANPCDFWSFEWELGVGECLFKYELVNCEYEPYSRWHQRWDDENWQGWSGPAVCDFDRPPYTSIKKPPGQHTGSDGGSFAIGGRSFSLWKFTSVTTPLELMFDSGDAFEVATTKVANDLCQGCDVPGSNCETRCPFNSDDAPPKLDDRSDAKGPEPESTTTGVTVNGDTLAFIGLERTGGIVTYDISDPVNPQFHDFLNVRNWLVTEASIPSEDADDYGDYMLTYALNDGPENLVFIPADDSPIGRDILLAVSPLAGRLTTYLVEQGSPRTDDGSCASISTCQYLPTSVGGTGTARLLTLDAVCLPNAPCSGVPSDGTVTITVTDKKKSSDDTNPALLAVVIVLAIAVFLILLVALFFGYRARTYATKYNALTEKNILHETELSVRT